MTGATQARSDTAPRGEDIRLVEPKLEELRISGRLPLAMIGGDPDMLLEQAHALSTFMSLAMTDAEAIVHSGWTNAKGLKCHSAVFDMNMNIMSDAMDGIATLIALGLHGMRLQEHRQMNGGAA